MKRIISLMMALMFLTVFAIGGYAEEVQEDASDDSTMEEVMSLSLEEAVVLAVENSLDVSTAQMDYEITQLDRKEAKDDYDDYDDYTVSFSDADSLEAQMTTLMTSKGYNYQLALMTEEYSQRAIDYTAYDVEEEVIDLYYDILYALEDIEIKETAMVRAADSYDDTLKQFEVGRASQNDLDTAEYNLENARLQLENSRLDYESYLAEFNITLGLDIYSDIVFTSELQYELFTSNLTLDQMVANSLNKDSLYQSALYSRDYYSQYCDMLGSALDDTNFGQEAYANLVIAENDLKEIENQMLLSVIKTLNTFKQMENNIEISMLNIEEIEKTIEQQELQYQMGLCTYDDVLAMYDSLDSAENSLLSLTKTYCVTADQFNNSITE